MDNSSRPGDNQNDTNSDLAPPNSHQDDVEFQGIRKMTATSTTQSEEAELDRKRRKKMKKHMEHKRRRIVREIETNKRLAKELKNCNWLERKIREYDYVEPDKQLRPDSDEDFLVVDDNGDGEGRDDSMPGGSGQLEAGDRGTVILESEGAGGGERRARSRSPGRQSNSSSSSSRSNSSSRSTASHDSAVSAKSGQPHHPSQKSLLTDNPAGKMDSSANDRYKASSPPADKKAAIAPSAKTAAGKGPFPPPIERLPATVLEAVVAENGQGCSERERLVKHKDRSSASGSSSQSPTPEDSKRASQHTLNMGRDIGNEAGGPDSRMKGNNRTGSLDKHASLENNAREDKPIQIHVCYAGENSRGAKQSSIEKDQEQELLTVVNQYDMIMNDIYRHSNRNMADVYTTSASNQHREQSEESLLQRRNLLYQEINELQCKKIKEMEELFKVQSLKERVISQLEKAKLELSFLSAYHPSLAEVGGAFMTAHPHGLHQPRLDKHDVLAEGLPDRSEYPLRSASADVKEDDLPKLEGIGRYTSSERLRCSSPAPKVKERDVNLENLGKDASPEAVNDPLVIVAEPMEAMSSLGSLNNMELQIMRQRNEQAKDGTDQNGHGAKKARYEGVDDPDLDSRGLYDRLANAGHRRKDAAAADVDGNPEKPATGDPEMIRQMSAGQRASPSEESKKMNDGHSYSDSTNMELLRGEQSNQSGAWPRKTKDILLRYSKHQEGPRKRSIDDDSQHSRTSANEATSPSDFSIVNRHSANSTPLSNHSNASPKEPSAVSLSSPPVISTSVPTNVAPSISTTVSSSHAAKAAPPATTSQGLSDNMGEKVYPLDSVRHQTLSFSSSNRVSADANASASAKKPNGPSPNGKGANQITNRHQPGSKAPSPLNLNSSHDDSRSYGQPQQREDLPRLLRKAHDAGLRDDPVGALHPPHLLGAHLRQPGDRRSSLPEASSVGESRSSPSYRRGSGVPLRVDEPYRHLLTTSDSNGGMASARPDMLPTSNSQGHDLAGRPLPPQMAAAKHHYGGHPPHGRYYPNLGHPYGHSAASLSHQAQLSGHPLLPHLVQPPHHHLLHQQHQLQQHQQQQGAGGRVEGRQGLKGDGHPAGAGYLPPGGSGRPEPVGPPHAALAAVRHRHIYNPGVIPKPMHEPGSSSLVREPAMTSAAHHHPASTLPAITNSLGGMIASYAVAEAALMSGFPQMRANSGSRDAAAAQLIAAGSPGLQTDRHVGERHQPGPDRHLGYPADRSQPREVDPRTLAALQAQMHRYPQPKTAAELRGVPLIRPISPNRLMYGHHHHPPPSHPHYRGKPEDPTAEPKTLVTNIARVNNAPPRGSKDDICPKPEVLTIDEARKSAKTPTTGGSPAKLTIMGHTSSEAGHDVGAPVPLPVPERSMMKVDPSKCENCGRAAHFMCSSCKDSHYCSEGCQKERWTAHSLICKPLQC